MTCTRCGCTGFLNIEQVPEEIADNGAYAVLSWMRLHMSETDVQVCDCCGDGEGWYGFPGEHYGPDDPPGDDGPYARNGGLCRCN